MQTRVPIIIYISLPQFHTQRNKCHRCPSTNIQIIYSNIICEIKSSVLIYVKKPTHFLKARTHKNDTTRYRFTMRRRIVRIYDEQTTRYRNVSRSTVQCDRQNFSPVPNLFVLEYSQMNGIEVDHFINLVEKGPIL